MFDPHASKPVEVKFPPSGVFVLESRHSRDFRMEPVRNPYVKIVQVFSGAGWLVHRGNRTALKPRDIIFVPAGEQHHLEDDGAKPLGVYVLCVAKRVLATAGTDVLPTSVRRYPAPAWTNEFRALIRHLLHGQTLLRPGSDLMSTGLALQALALVARADAGIATHGSQRNDLPAQARVAAYANDLERTFFRRQRVDDAAAALGLSRRRFTQLFREATGCSWHAALQRHRLTHARKLLAETNRSVASIGYECGFEDITTFYRAFRSAERTSPLAWRRTR
jgi:AraC-like DNA-binding protein